VERTFTPGIPSCGCNRSPSPPARQLACVLVPGPATPHPTRARPAAPVTTRHARTRHQPATITRRTAETITTRRRPVCATPQHSLGRVAGLASGCDSAHRSNETPGSTPPACHPSDTVGGRQRLSAQPSSENRPRTPYRSKTRAEQHERRRPVCRQSRDRDRPGAPTKRPIPRALAFALLSANPTHRSRRAISPSGTICVAPQALRMTCAGDRLSPIANAW